MCGVKQDFVALFIIILCFQTMTSNKTTLTLYVFFRSLFTPNFVRFNKLVMDIHHAPLDKLVESTRSWKCVVCILKYAKCDEFIFIKLHMRTPTHMSTSLYLCIPYCYGFPNIKIVFGSVWNRYVILPFCRQFHSKANFTSFEYELKYIINFQSFSNIQLKMSILIIK